MFSVSSAASLRWYSGRDSQQTDETPRVSHFATAAGVQQDLVLPPAETGFGAEVQFQATVTCGPGGEIGYRISGGVQAQGGRDGQVQAITGVDFQDSIHVVSAAQPPAKLLVTVRIETSGTGDLSMNGANLRFVFNGIPYNSSSGRLQLSADLESPVDLPFQFSFSDSVSFRSNERGSLARGLTIESLTIADAQGSPIEVRYTTQSGSAYPIVGGTYGVVLTAT
jgi:hypothetical protein